MTKHIQNIKIRRANIDDLLEMQELFVDTIKSVCKNDYNEEQIRIWTSSVENKEKWETKLKEQYCLVAEIEGKIVGFGSLFNGDFIDLMYVHKDYLRQGIADCLYQELEKESTRIGYHTLYSDVSITAKPFFEKKGFKINKENKNIIKGVEIINYRMKKEK